MASKVNLEHVPLAAIVWGLFCLAFFAAGAVTDVLAFHYVGWATVNVLFVSVAFHIIDRLQFRSGLRVPQYSLILVWLAGVFMFQTINPDSYEAELEVGDSLYLQFLRMSEPIGLFLCILMLLCIIFYMMFASNKTNKLQNEKVVGALGYVKKWKRGAGKIMLDSFEGTKFPRPNRKWKAYSNEALSVGDRVKVLALDKKKKKVEVFKATVQERSESCSTPISDSDRIKSRNFGIAAAALVITGFVADIMDIMLLTWLLPIGVGGFACALVINIERKTDDPISPGMFAWLWAAVAGEICYAWFLL